MAMVELWLKLRNYPECTSFGQAYDKKDVMMINKSVEV